jgi:PAT family beta-lactamase induction signal transducer AmpG
VRLPNLLATRRGRLLAFFALYLTEGIPLGFAATAMATQMRRQGLGAAAIGAFVGAIYLPWAFKWAVGPVVDVLSSDRFGRRRAWIIAMQLLMVASLFLIMAVGMSASLATLTAIIILHNSFAATQDVAIDALAVNTLHADERGVANGLMFGGAYLGQAVGGSGALLLAPVIGFGNTYFFVAAAILVVTVFVAWPMREVPSPRPVRAEQGVLRQVGGELREFAVATFRAFAGSRAAWVALLFALLPAGAYALGLALVTNLAVELGFDDSRVGQLTLWTTVLAAAGCVAGGWLSDRLGRRRMLALFIASMSLPTLWLAWSMSQAGWIMPVSDAPGVVKPVASAALIATFWTTALVYSAFNGLMYGTRSALFMDVTTPRVAATQFTAYMALMNLTIAYSSNWQGWATEHHGYPLTLLADSLFGLLCLVFLPLMSRATPAEPTEPSPSSAAVR